MDVLCNLAFHEQPKPVHSFAHLPFVRHCLDCWLNGKTDQHCKRQHDRSAAHLLERASGELQKHLVLMADELDEFRAVCHDLQIDSHCKRLRIRFRIINGEFDV